MQKPDLYEIKFRNIHGCVENWCVTYDYISAALRTICNENHGTLVSIINLTLVPTVS